jgi:murein DD-endopeptidase MepM/ murein hydrolase activator NlpD
MSSAKRTPRYVDAILPFEVAEGGRSAEVIRLRPDHPVPKLPPITRAWPRAKAVPVSRRPWQLLLVPPTPGAPTRSFNVALWHARVVMVAASALIIVAGAGVTAFVIAVRSPSFFAARDEAALLRARLTIVEDSLALARAALEDPGEMVATAGTVSAPGSAGVTEAPSASAKPAVRLAPPAVRAARRTAPVVDDDASVSAGGGAFEGLPVIGAIASRFSRARRHPLLHVIRPHLGVDVAARRGTKIIAPAPGRVTFVGRKFGFGLVLEIQHSNGVTTRYAHCGSALVAEGSRVVKGTPIATVGTSGLSTGPHLHYEVLVNGHQVDPLRFRLPQMTDSAATTAPTSLQPHAPTSPLPSPAGSAAGGTPVVTPGAPPSSAQPSATSTTLTPASIPRPTSLGVAAPK